MNDVRPHLSSKAEFSVKDCCEYVIMVFYCLGQQVHFIWAVS